MSEVIPRYWLPSGTLTHDHPYGLDDTCVVPDWAYDKLKIERDQLRAELVALKAGQGEAVAWADPLQLAALLRDCGASCAVWNSPGRSRVPLYLAPPASADAVSVPIDFVRFLLGEADLNGYSFGDMHQVRVGKFWWRTELRAMIAQSQGVKP